MHKTGINGQSGSFDIRFSISDCRYAKYLGMKIGYRISHKDPCKQADLPHRNGYAPELKHSSFHQDFYMESPKFTCF